MANNQNEPTVLVAEVQYEWCYFALKGKHLHMGVNVPGLTPLTLEEMRTLLQFLDEARALLANGIQEGEVQS
jgi:hypothetical protein